MGGPWVDCPQAFWLRRVVTEAGFTVIDDTPSALLMEAGPYELHVWNVSAKEGIEDVAEAENYEPREQTDAYSDGQRVVWEAQGLHIYMSLAGVTDVSIDDIPTHIIDRLIAASRAVPREVDTSDAKPLPEPTATELRSEEQPDGSVLIYPVSADVPNEGKYLFSAPHCGLDWMIDFDGSFWEAEEPDDYKENPDAYPFFINSDNGTIEFRSDDEAAYQASTGELIPLTRLPGPIASDPCA